MKPLKSIILAVIIFYSSISFAKVPPEGFADIVQPLLPAVVNIATTQKITKSSRRDMPLPFPEGSPFEEFNQFFERFAHPYKDRDEESANPKNKPISLGSGFIIDPKGYIVTNNHVISEAEEITVRLSSGNQLKAKIIGTDKKTDLALLKVNYDKPLPYVKFGDSDKSRVGDWIIAIGNPFGLGGTVTAGIISAHERDIQPDGLVDNFIQTDAAINRGNSGGPMFNVNGEVIGINTAILSPSGVYIGIGFATPSSVAKLVIEQLKTKGKIERGMLGVMIQQVSNDIAESLGLKEDRGALIVDVVKGSAASRAGLQVGDVIIEFDGKKIEGVRKFTRIVAESPLNKKIVIKYIRNGKQNSTEVTLHQESDDEQDSKKTDITSSKVLGAEIAPLTQRLRGKFNVENNIHGLIMLDVPRKTIWYKTGFVAGDVIMRANNTKLQLVTDLEKVIKQAKVARKKSILLLVYRNGNVMFIPMELR